MNKLAILLLFIVIIAAYLMVPKMPTICFSKADISLMDPCVSVEYAMSDASRAKGLMNRTDISYAQGMFFIFPVEKRYAFWMKDTPTPLDMIWLDADLNIVHIESALPCGKEPCEVYRTPTPALYVLETRQGFVKDHGIAVGDRAYSSNPTHAPL